MNTVRVFNIIELNPELTLSNNACTGTMAIPSFVERHTTIVFRGFVDLTDKPQVQMGFALLVFRVIEGELRAWKPVRSLGLIGGFNKLFSILML